MAQKNYKPLLVIGILSIVIALAGIFLLEPPGNEPEPQASGTPEQYQTVLRPEDMVTPSAQASATQTAVRTERPTASRSPAGRPTATRTARAATAPASTAATARPTATRRAQTTATRRPLASATRQRTTSPAASVQPSATPPATETPAPSETQEYTVLPSMPNTPEQTPPAPASAPDEETEQGSLPPAASAPQLPAQRRAESSGTSSASAAESSPAILRGSGLLAAADSRFTITAEGVEEAGGMKLIEGFPSTGTAVLRDIRNTLLTSSSLVKGYKEGEEIGGFEPVGTGTVLELSTRGGEVVDTAVVLIPGDVNGSGTLDISQLARVAAAVEGRQPLSGVYFLAADVDSSGVLDEGDLMAMSFVLNRRAAGSAASGA